MASNLVLTADLVASPSLIDAAASLLSCSAQQLSLATQSGTVGNGAASSSPLPSSAFAGAMSFGPAGHHTPALLGAICKALKPGAKLVLQETSGGTTAAEASLKSNLLLAGLTSPEVSSDGTTLKAFASKPIWETGAKAAIALKPRTAAAAAPAAAAPAAAAAWKLSAADEDEELIDEDELLTEEDLQRPAVPAGVDDCSVSKKACKNCSCGRAEEEAAGVKREVTQEMLNNPQSACGSCGLGDAFRCGSCPYKGLPPFQPGAKIQLASDLLTADF